MKNRSSMLRQEGATALIIVLVLLVAMTIVAFAANRSQIGEVKTSANQYRGTQAAEAAEAGLDWALAQLNYAQIINTSCTATTAAGSRTFRDRYLDNDGNGSFAPLANQFVGCTRLAAGWSCSCPAPTGTAPTFTPTAPTFAACNVSSGCPTFSVTFASVTGDASAIQVTATGCSTNGTPCVAGAASAADASATARVILKVKSALITPPAAPLTVRGNVDFGSNAITVTNTDPGTNGITINSGGTITGFVSESTIKTVPGSPAGASLVGGDTSLAGLSDDAMFKTFFGQTADAMKSASTTHQLSCASGCGNSEFQAALNAGKNVIWVNGSISLNGNDTFGSATKPVILIATGDIHLNGNMTLYGVVYSAGLTWNNTGGGTSKIIGAALAQGDFTTTGTPDPTYDASVLSLLKSSAGDFVRVPGSWRDF